MLHIAQHRRREKDFLHAAGFPTAPFEHVPDYASLAPAIERLGTPCVLKTAGFGYDGKGQVVIHARQQAQAAWQAIGQGEAVLEGFFDFACEVSVVAARGVDGAFMDHTYNNPGADPEHPDGALQFCNGGGKKRTCWSFTPEFTARFIDGHNWLLNHTQTILAATTGGPVIGGMQKHPDPSTAAGAVIAPGDIYMLSTQTPRRWT